MRVDGYLHFAAFDDANNISVNVASVNDARILDEAWRELIATRMPSRREMSMGRTDRTELQSAEKQPM